MHVTAEKIKFNFDENSTDNEDLELKDNEAVINGDDMKLEVDNDFDDDSFQ